MTPDYSDQIAFAVAHARRYYPFAFRAWEEDAKQTAILGALTAKESTCRAVSNAVSIAMRHLMRDMLEPDEVYVSGIVRRRSERASRMWAARRLGSIGIDTREIADKTGLAVSTFNRYTRSSRTSEEVHRLRSDGGRKGSPIGLTARWGNYDARRMQARAMRAAGSTLAEIRDACGYKSLSAVHYAARRIHDA